MHKQRLIFLLYMLATAISFSSAFNIDLRNPEVYTGDAEDFFGYKVFQVGSKENKGIIVTAPLHLNGSGAVYRRGPKQSLAQFGPKEITLGEEDVPVKHLGLSIAKDFTSSQFTVCSPSVVTKCYKNSYMNSVCYKLTDQLQELSSFNPAFQDCTKKKVDLVFMFDGSKSMLQAEFDKNKEFIEDIMKQLENSSINFAAVQFSRTERTVFTFNDYRSGNASRLLQNETHMNSLTNTHSALRFVMREHFNTTNGATPDATKVLVVITDGDPSDVDDGIIKEYDSKNIIRFVIGVKNVALDKLKTIASEPKDKNCFQIESYGGLTSLLEKFQEKKFLTEGTKAALAGDLTEEMSQSGFSAIFSQDTLILGSVGSNTWRGSLHEHREKEKERQIKDPEMEEDSYMGYSVSAGERNKTVLYFTGAPRYNHTGQVILFTQRGNEWTPTQRINGEQLGSYFGAEVCSLDVDSDGSTDFLLVGAPLFYQPHEKKEGKIYIYRLTDELKLIYQLNVTAPAMGRFGTTITSVADLNGDRLRDVVVGAPLENQNRGAVYIYLGDRSRGIRSTYSQRIMGENITPNPNPELRFFGQSVDGSHDLGEDGLPDLVVGSRGSALVFRSRPVFNVTTHLSFEPEEISIENIICPSNMDDILPPVNLSVCFEMVEATRSTAGAVTPGMNISYTLNVDPMRQTFRGFFYSTTKSTKSRNLMETNELRENNTCFKHLIYMMKCVSDTLSPISIKLNFLQVDSERADVVLNADSGREASVEVPFERRCRNNDTCIAELEVDFNFTTPTLLVADGNYFNVTITLSNHGEDAYNTSLTMLYPSGLSYAMMTLDEKTKSRPLYVCEDYEGKTTCGISLPVYRSGSAATFTSAFHVTKDYEWKNNASVTIVGKSDNQKNSTKGSLTKTIPVQIEIKMTLLIGDESTNYMNFTTEDSAPKKLVTKYKVDNHGWREFSAKVALFFPTKLEHNFEIKNYQVLIEQNTTKCRENDTELDVKSKYCTPERKCKFIICDAFILKKYTDVEFELSAEAHFKDLEQHASNIPFLKKYTGDGETVEFKSFLHVAYDKKKYALDSENQKRQGERSEESGFWDDNDPSMKSSEIKIELVVLPNKWLIIATGVGLGLLLLIFITFIMFKLGFFKRKIDDMVQEDEEKEAAGESAAAVSSVAVNPPETKGTDGKPEEDKALLEKQGATLSTEIDDLQNGHK